MDKSSCFSLRTAHVFTSEQHARYEEPARIRLEGPIAVAENGYALPVCLDAVDVQVLGADHEIDVRGAFVHAALEKFLGAHLQAAFVAIGEALSERKVAAGILVEERAIEKYAGITNGAVEGNEGHFTKAAGVFVGFHDRAQHVFACFRMQLNYAAVFERKAEVVYQAAVVGKRHGGDHGAVRAHAIRSGENLFGGHVREELHAVDGGVPATVEQMFFRQAHREVGAVGVGVVQGVEALFVKPCAAFGKAVAVRAPSGDGFVGIGALQADGGEDGLP